MIAIEEVHEMLKAILRGEPRPKDLNFEQSVKWTNLENDVRRILAKGGSVDLSFEIPEL